MKIRKRLTASLLSIVMILTILTLGTGCQSNETKEETPATSVDNHGLDPKAPTTISIWHYFTGEQATLFDSFVEKFNQTIGKKQGIVVEAVSHDTVAPMMTKIAWALNGKDGADPLPDMFISFAGTAATVDAKGKAANLDTYFTKEELSEYVPDFIKEGRIGADDGLKLFPIEKSLQVLVLNQKKWDEFADATGAKTEDLSTWEGVAKTAEAYYNWTNTGSGGKAFFGLGSIADYMMIGSKQLGKDLLKVENNTAKPTIDKATVRTLWDNYYVPYVNGYYRTQARIRATDLANGDIIAYTGSTASITAFPENVTPLILPLPAFEKGTPWVSDKGPGIVVTKSNETREYASAVFIKWFTEKNRNIQFAAAAGSMPVRLDANDPKAIAKQLDKDEKNPNAKILKAALTGAAKGIGSRQFYPAVSYKNQAHVEKVINNSMEQKAQTDLEKVRGQIKKGIPKDIAVGVFAADINFDLWYEDFVKAVTAAIAK